MTAPAVTRLHVGCAMWTHKPWQGRFLPHPLPPGDRHAAIDDAAHSLQPLLDMYENDEAGGEGDMPYPPDYPKMPGEPKRVQPSRDRDRKHD